MDSLNEILTRIQTDEDQSLQVRIGIWDYEPVSYYATVMSCRRPQRELGGPASATTLEEALHQLVIKINERGELK